MRFNRWLIGPALILLVLFGATLAFDRRFVPLSDLKNIPIFVAFIYAPTAFFAIIGAIQFYRKRIWPALAFAAGLIGTGLFHQSVIDVSYGNPGYMVATGHIFAPLVSIAAYSISFLAAWGIARVGSAEWIPKLIKYIRDVLAI